MKTSKKSREGGARTAALDLGRTQIATRLDEEVYRKVAEAAAFNRTSISAEVARRVTRSFDPQQPQSDDALQDLGREIMAAFEAGGRFEIRTSSEDGLQVLPASEWIKNPVAYTEAATRALEVLADYHPEPRYGLCLQMIYALRARLDRAWQRLLMDMSLEDAKAAKRDARALAETFSTPSLLDPLYFPPKAED